MKKSLKGRTLLSYNQHFFKIGGRLFGQTKRFENPNIASLVSLSLNPVCGSNCQTIVNVTGKTGFIGKVK